MDRRDFEGAAVSYVFFALPQILSSIGSLLLSCPFLKTGYQDAEVKRMHLERDLVLCLLQIVAGNNYFGSRNPVGLTNSDQLGQWLGNHCATGHQRQLPLRENQALR